MIDHTVHWPALGITDDEDESKNEFRRKMLEDALFRRVVLTQYIAAAVVYVATMSALALATAAVATMIAGVTVTGPGLYWVFIASVVFIMIIDELLPWGTHSSVRYGAGFVVMHMLVYSVTAWFALKHRRNNIGRASDINEIADRTFLPRIGIRKGRRRFD